MNYLQSLAYLESLSPTTQKPCLERIYAFLQEKGEPQNQFGAIHVAGTNGKGSTVAILDTLLRKGGLKVGRFTGPHLLRWNERFHVNGCPISDSDFAEIATRMRTLSEDFGRRNPQFGPLTWFELLTAMAYFYFAETGVEVAVIEVGLGGRFDATNVLQAPKATAIVNVDLDHTKILGETIEQIANEKAGIIKESVPVVTAAVGDALQVVATQAKEMHAPLWHCQIPDLLSVSQDHRQYCKLSKTNNTQLMTLLSAKEKLSLMGIHQELNALVACGVLVASGLDVNLLAHGEEVVADGFNSVYWPGRLQYMKDIGLILDGAHNPAGAKALNRSLRELFPNARFRFVLGCFQNKDVEAMLSALLAKGDQVFAAEAESKRPVCSAKEIVVLSTKMGIKAGAFPSVREALSEAMQTRLNDEIVVATGSFATVREAMLYLGWQTVEDGICASQGGAKLKGQNQLGIR